ncbi:transcriptional regulator [Cutibacterium acnes JCM 18909]|nr:transcriptional regulator [Cutibacterium acnes JCM 18909]
MAATTKSFTRRGPYAKGVARRAEILDVALRLYGASSGERPTLTAIAAEVGLTEQAFCTTSGRWTNYSWRFLRLVTSTRSMLVVSLTLTMCGHTWPRRPALRG